MEQNTVNLKLLLVSLTFLTVAFSVSLDLQLQYGEWFSFGDWHHETWVVMFVGLFLAFLVLALLNFKMGNRRRTR